MKFVIVKLDDAKPELKNGPATVLAIVDAVSSMTEQAKLIYAAIRACGESPQDVRVRLWQDETADLNVGDRVLRGVMSVRRVSKDDELIKTLLDASDALMAAHRKCRDAGREDLAQFMRHAAWDVAAAMAAVVKDSSKEQPS